MFEQKTELPAETCESCGNAEFEATEVRSAFWHDDRLVVVEDIPAMVCKGCGEQYFDDTVVTLLDLMHGDGYPAEAARSEIQVSVFSIRDRLAGRPA